MEDFLQGDTITVKNFNYSNGFIYWQLNCFIIRFPLGSIDKQNYCVDDEDSYFEVKDKYNKVYEYQITYPEPYIRICTCRMVLMEKFFAI